MRYPIGCCRGGEQGGHSGGGRGRVDAGMGRRRQGGMKGPLAGRGQRRRCCRRHSTAQGAVKTAKPHRCGMAGQALETSGTMTAAPPEPATLPTTPAMPPTGRDRAGHAARCRSAASCCAAGDSSPAAADVARRSCCHRAAGSGDLLPAAAVAAAAAARLRALTPLLTAADAPDAVISQAPCALCTTAAGCSAARRSAARAWRLSILLSRTPQAQSTW